MRRVQVDFQKAVRDLQSLGYTQRQIGEHIGVDRAVITRLASGEQRELRFTAGFGLLVFASREVTKLTEE